MRGAERLTAPASSAPLLVLDGSASRALDAATIAAGTPSYALMARAGHAVAALLRRRLADPGAGHGIDEAPAPDASDAGSDNKSDDASTDVARTGHAVCVLAGVGNNGGDGYVIAAALAAAGVPVRVVAAGAPRTDDATRARRALQAAHPQIAVHDVAADASPATVTALFGEATYLVDALLGVGSSGPLRGAVAAIATAANAAIARGVPCVAVDVPTGVEATTGDVVPHAIRAQATACFGGVKLGVLAARAHAGEIYAIDLDFVAAPPETPRLVSFEHAAAALPPIAWDAHKGRRGHVRIVGGRDGMGGAVHFAARAALASGAGLVRARVAASTAHALQAALPAVMTEVWPVSDRAARDAAPFDPTLDEMLAVHLTERPGTSADAAHDDAWAHAVLLGPGLGRDDAARAQLGREHAVLCDVDRRAVVIDADALTLIAAADPVAWLAPLAARHLVVLTPHPGEFATLARAAGLDAAANATIDARVRDTLALANRTGAVIVHKGTPTIVAAPHTGDAPRLVARGSSVLSTGGSGDVLAGMIAGLLGTDVVTRERGASTASETSDAPDASRPIALAAADIAAAAAFVHGLAAEFCDGTGAPRGRGVADVIDALPYAFDAIGTPDAHGPVLPSVRG